MWKRVVFRGSLAICLLAGLGGGSAFAQAKVTSQNAVSSVAKQEPLQVFFNIHEQSPDSRKDKCTACHATAPAKDAKASKSCLRDLMVDDAGVQQLFVKQDRDTRAPADSYGIEFVAVDDALRAQAAIPPKQGLLVREIAAGSPLKDYLAQYDVVLKVNDAPICTVQQYAEKIIAKPQPAVIDLVRQGKPMRVHLVGNLKLDNGPVVVEGKLIDAQTTPAPSDFWIGTSVSPVDETLRSHLPALRKEVLKDAGLVVLEVHKGSPAEKAAVQKNDVLCTLDFKPLKSTEDLVARVQDCGGKKVKLQLVRNGELLSIDVEPAKRPKPTTPITVQGTDLALSLNRLNWYEANGAYRGALLAAQNNGETLARSLTHLQPQDAQWQNGQSAKVAKVTQMQAADFLLTRLAEQLDKMQADVAKLRQSVEKQNQRNQSQQQEQLLKAIEELRAVLKAQK